MIPLVHSWLLITDTRLHQPDRTRSNKHLCASQLTAATLGKPNAASLLYSVLTHAMKSSYLQTVRKSRNIEFKERLKIVHFEQL